MTEVNKTPETENENKTEVKQKESVLDLLIKNRIVLVAVIAAFVILAFVMPKSGLGGNSGTLISPFGQEPIPSWVELPNQQQAEIIAKFPIHYPEELEKTSDSMVFNVFGSQIIEIQFKENGEDLRAVIGKAKAGTDLDADKSSYRKIEIIDIGDLEVTTKGNNDTISVAMWTNGDFNYYLGVQNHPVTEEELAVLVRELY